MKKITAFLACLAVLSAMTACGNDVTSSSQSEESQKSTASTDSEQETTDASTSAEAVTEASETVATDSESPFYTGQYPEGETEPDGVPCITTLKMDFTDGSDTANILEVEYIYCYRNPDGEEVPLVPEDVIRGLEEETGFSFSANIVQQDDGILIDFNEDSSLFSGDQKLDHDEKYTFVYTPSRQWFMLDTVAENLDRFGENFNVYVSYCGQPIVLDEVLAFDGTDTRTPDGPITIPNDKFYQGSSWYCAHVEDYKGNTAQ